MAQNDRLIHKAETFAELVRDFKAILAGKKYLSNAEQAVVDALIAKLEEENGLEQKAYLYEDDIKMPGSFLHPIVAIQLVGIVEEFDDYFNQKKKEMPELRIHSSIVSTLLLEVVDLKNDPYP